ncbi:tetratricopeptide repeat protein [Terricaulis sp.]|uniref:tetratricopeptide repeat protein n=1 Tax=Terricaulis sp. TaxID=2768686 RepID=UPI0037831711
MAESPRARADQQGNAQYYTARAIATLREQGQQADLSRAATLLDLVVRVPWPDAEPLRDRARLQLARVYRLQIEAERARGAPVDPRAFSAALALLDQTLRTNGGPNNAVALDARYERALVYLQRRDAGDAEAALRDLSIFATQIAAGSAWSTAGQRGRTLLVRSAQALGDEIIETPTQANIERALDYYERAQAAVEMGGPPLTGVDLPGLYIDLGTATLSKAALQRGVGVDRRCQPNVTHPEADQLLQRARGNFETAMSFPGHSPRAEQGSGCAFLALRQIDLAIRSFEAAYAAGARDVNDLLELARGYANAGAILEAQQIGDAQRYWMRAEETYQLAISMAGADARLRSRINVELARTRQARGDFAGAWTVLTAALADDGNSPEALLARGRLVCMPAGEEPCVSLSGISTPQEARADLSAVINQIPTPDPQLRGEAHFYLSWIARRTENGLEAVRNADSAASLAMSAEYRRHACLMRIRYYHLRGIGVRDERVRDEGTRYCLAGETRAPEALLLEGEYHLSRARSLSGGARDRAREEAYSVFGEGLRLLGRSDSALNDELQHRFELGQALVQYCMGLEGVGSSAINRIDPGGTIRQYFVAHEVWNCEPR